MTSLQDLMNTPVTNASAHAPQVLGNLAQLTPAARPAVVNHYNVQPVIDVYASTQGRDLGGVASDIMKALKPFQDHLPRGTRIVVRGQIETMQSSFFGLGVGLLGAIVLVYLLIVVNFQSWLDPFIIITALPGALAGICWFLLITRTTLNVPSLTGAVMCMGVATANSILLVSFSRDRMDTGVPALQAALEAGYTRMRPVHHDGPGHDYRHGADGVGFRRRRRAERAAGPRRDWRLALRNRRHLIFRAECIYDYSWPPRGAAASESNENREFVGERHHASTTAAGNDASRTRRSPSIQRSIGRPISSAPAGRGKDSGGRRAARPDHRGRGYISEPEERNGRAGERNRSRLDSDRRGGAAPSRTWKRRTGVARKFAGL